MSAQEAFLGYLLALGIGLPLGLFMGWFGVVRGIARPLFELIRPIPPIAWIPLTIFWFGIGLGGKVFIRDTEAAEKQSLEDGNKRF